MTNPKDIQTRLTEEEFQNIETAAIHTSYRQEKAILECVKAGDLELLQKTYQNLPAVRYGRMSSSSNPIKQLFYGGIANTTLVTRYAIEGGMDEERAFSLSDIYIKKMERATKEQDLEELNMQMAIDFTKQVAMAKEKARSHYSTPILQTMHLIYERSHEKILLEDLASQVNLSPKYLSALFKKETGQTISNYILHTRIEEAKHLLTYTDYSSSQISEHLAFHSQSYFIQVFKSTTGLTPNQYRNKQGLIN